MNKVNTICVCGAGTMGSGIAQVAAQSGFTTILFDVNEAVLSKAKFAIETSLQKLQEKGKISQEQQIVFFKSISFTSKMNECKADLIIEAIIEKQEAKVNLFNQLSQINTNNTIFATNTSSISINAIANDCTSSTNIIGMHFFNPATIMKLVEIVKTNTTNNKIIETLMAVCKQMNKVAVVCKDSPGFIVNRVARHYYLEALTLVEKGFATYENIDTIMEASGFKMGPFKLMDLIGMDINFGVSNIVYKAMGKPARLKPSIVQQHKVEAGELGKKTGKGFYSY